MMHYLFLFTPDYNQCVWLSDIKIMLCSKLKVVNLNLFGLVYNTNSYNNYYLRAFVF